MKTHNSNNPSPFSIVSSVNEEDIATTEKLARKIWRDHYKDIISHGQIEYMLRRFQSATAIKEQIEAGYHYYLISDRQQALGYFSFQIRRQELFLSKIYIDARYRGKGAGFSAFGFIENEAQKLGVKTISLTVNRHNSIALSAYQRWGMVISGELVTDIGNGFVMDDYCLEKRLGDERPR